MADRRLLFVYGSLKQGLSRHRFIVDQELLGEAQTEARYSLFDFGDYPGLVAGESAISGEVYRVAEAAWPILDDVECVSSGLYTCELIRLQPPFVNEDVWAYFYAQPIPATAPKCSVWPPESPG